LSAISPAGIFRVDTSGTITYGNQKWREITGNKETLDDSIGEKLLAAVHPDDREWIKEHWNTGLANVERFSFEVRWGSRDSFRWAMGELVPEIIGDEVWRAM
jgi:PAS domain S-box-containing protein